ncbi:hypothetical protein ACWERV_23055 [Streptomyces sp. NPDC004031]
MPRLTHDQVADARRRYARREASAAVLAAELGVSVSAVKHAVTGRSWASMTDPPPVHRPQARRGSRPAGRTPALTPHSVRDIVRLRDTERPTWRAIGALYGVNASVAYRAYQSAKRRQARRPPAGLVQRRPPYAGKLRKLWKSPDLTVREITAELGITYRAAVRWAADMGLPPPKQRQGFRGASTNSVHGKAAAKERLRVLWADPLARMTDIAAELGVGQYKVRRWVAELELPPRPRRRPEARRLQQLRQQKLLALWTRPDVVVRQIAEELGVCPATVYRWAADMQLPERRRGRKRAR